MQVEERIEPWVRGPQHFDVVLKLFMTQHEAELIDQKGYRSEVLAVAQCFPGQVIDYTLGKLIEMCKNAEQYNNPQLSGFTFGDQQDAKRFVQDLAAGIKRMNTMLDATKLEAGSEQSNNSPKVFLEPNGEQTTNNWKLETGDICAHEADKQGLVRYGTGGVAIITWTSKDKAPATVHLTGSVICPSCHTLEPVEIDTDTTSDLLSGPKVNCNKCSNRFNFTVWTRQQDGAPRLYVTAMGFSRPIGSGSVLPIVTIDNVKESTNKQPVQEPEPDTHEPMTLHWASDICQNREKLRQALASGIDINARDAEVGATALHIMATLGRVEAVRNLLEAGADPNIRLSTGKSTADVLSHNIQHDTGRGKETAEQILQLLQNASQQTKGTTPGINITKCRFWVCLSCTSVLEKMNLEQDIIKYSMPGETLEGRRCECPNCHRSYRAHDVYTGKYDLPREAWTRMQARDGRPIEVTVRKTTEGCFIATSCYGSYDHPAVREFRWFRDHNLIKCPFGRQMVAAYYRTSPSLATFLTQRPKLAAVVRQCILNPIRLVISNLHKKNIL